MPAGLLTIDDCVERARQILPRFVFDYVSGGADDESCLSANRRDLDAVTLLPRVLRDTSNIDTSIEVFGSGWAYPFAIAPTGLNGLIHPAGDIALAAAADDIGVPFTLSTASTTRIEDLRRALPLAELWLQLYVMEDRSVAEQLMDRARAAGFRALVLTVDVAVGGLRQRDLQNGFRLPLRLTPRLVFDLLTHPRWALQQLANGFPRICNMSADPRAKPSTQANAAMLSRTMDRRLDWDCLSWIRSHWKGPLLIKGLLHPADALRAVESGIDGIIVSNHGGRQFDAAPSTIGALPAIVAAVGERIPVFMDSGIRSGTDIARALACGARAVFIGRPVLHGLAAGGRAGCVFVLSQLAEGLQRAMILLGSTRVANLPRLTRPPAMRPPGSCLPELAATLN